MNFELHQMKIVDIKIEVKTLNFHFTITIKLQRTLSIPFNSSSFIDIVFFHSIVSHKRNNENA